MQMLTLRATSWKWSRSSSCFSKRTCLNQGLADRLPNNYFFSLMPCGQHLAQVSNFRTELMDVHPEYGKELKTMGWIRNEPLCVLLAG